MTSKELIHTNMNKTNTEVNKENMKDVCFSEDKNHLHEHSCCSFVKDGKNREHTQAIPEKAATSDSLMCNYKQWLLLLLLPFFLAAFTVFVASAYYYVRITFLDFADSRVRLDESAYFSRNDINYCPDHVDSHANSWSMENTNTTIHTATTNSINCNNNNNYNSFIDSKNKDVIWHGRNHKNDNQYDDTSEYHLYNEAYWVLRPGMTLINQSLPNPALWKNNNNKINNNAKLNETFSAAHENSPKELNKISETNCNVHKRRYVLDGLERGRRYMLRLCYLGSPSVWYQINFLHVRKSFITQIIDTSTSKHNQWTHNEQNKQAHFLTNLASHHDDKSENSNRANANIAEDVKKSKNNNFHIEEEEEQIISTRHKMSNNKEDIEFHLLDTEVRMFSMHALHPRQFAWDGITIETESWPFAMNKWSNLSSETSSSATVGGAKSALELDRHAFVAVIEIVPHILAETVSPERFPIIYYNIHLDTLTGNCLPDVAFPYIVTVSMIVFLPLYVALQNTNIQLTNVRNVFIIFTCVTYFARMFIVLVRQCTSMLITLFIYIFSLFSEANTNNNSTASATTHVIVKSSDNKDNATKDHHHHHHHRSNDNSEDVSRADSATKKVSLDDSVKVTSEYILPDDIHTSQSSSTASSMESLPSSFESPSSSSSTNVINTNTSL